VSRGRLRTAPAILALIALLALAPAGLRAQRPANGEGDAGPAGAPASPVARAADATRATIWFPGDEVVAGPIAAPLEPRFTAGLIGTTLLGSTSAPGERPAFFVDDAGSARLDMQAMVGLGATVPVVQGVRGGMRWGLAVQAGVTERFRLEVPSRDALGGDWIAALPVEAAWGRWAARLRFFHRSAHLGDEFMQEAGARRIEFSHEAADLLVARGIGPYGRAYAGGTFVLRSQTHTVMLRAPARPDAEAVPVLQRRHDRFGLQAGLELSQLRWVGNRIGPLAAVDWQRTNHPASDRVSALAGLTGRLRGRTGRLFLHCHAGASPMGEFFLTPERFCGIAAGLEL
jgi:hypothetical protein